MNFQRSCPPRSHPHSSLFRCAGKAISLCTIQGGLTFKCQWKCGVWRFCLHLPPAYWRAEGNSPIIRSWGVGSALPMPFSFCVCATREKEMEDWVGFCCLSTYSRYQIPLSLGGLCRLRNCKSREKALAFASLAPGAAHPFWESLCDLYIRHMQHMQPRRLLFMESSLSASSSVVEEQGWSF